MSTNRTQRKYKKVNAKGETLLHLAAKDISRKSQDSITNLLTKGEDINARNKWGQTPLHYAAISGCLHTIETLTKSSGIDINSRDVNGYNALQSLIARDDGESDYALTFRSYRLRVLSADRILDDVEMSDKSVDLRKSLQALVNAGIDVNNQTVFGDGVLHLIALRKDNPPLLKFFISNFPDIRLNLINKKKENFLHAYVPRERLEYIVKLFEWIADKYSGSIMKELSSTKDIRGQTPWTLMIGNTGEYADFRNIFGYAVSPDIIDNRGNTFWQQTCVNSYNHSHLEFLEYMLKIGADINVQNMYGETILSMAVDEKILKILLEYKPDFEVKDRWGRSVLSSVMKYGPLPDFLKALMKTGIVNVNSRDNYGSSPLHFAAYHDLEEQMKLLLEYGADINTRDDLQERPLDTARRHKSIRCIAFLKKEVDRKRQGYTLIYTRIQTVGDQAFEDILCGLPETIRSSFIKSPQDIQTILHLPLKLNDFMNYLLESYHTTSQSYCSEVDAVIFDVNNLVKSICKQIKKYDSRFEMSVFPSGSMVEGTKIGCPDEFDFILCLDTLNDITDIVMTDDLLKSGFASLKFTQGSDEYLSFSNDDGYFLPIVFLRVFSGYLTRALLESHLWKDGNLYHNVKNNLSKKIDKPVFKFDVYWSGSVYKQMRISIDLVPAVYRRGWWPLRFDGDKIPFFSTDMKAAGCCLILQTLSSRSPMSDSDCISRTCNIDENDDEHAKKSSLQISAAPVEICCMKSVSNIFRKAYVLAKILIKICPDIDVETEQYKQIDFEYSKPRRIKPSTLFKSYVIKNSIFYVLDGLKVTNQSKQDMDVFDITIKMFNFLLKFIDSGQINMRPYFLSSDDINAFDQSKELSFKKSFMLSLTRELSIKLVLGMLNEIFTRECLAAKIFQFGS